MKTLALIGCCTAAYLLITVRPEPLTTPGGQYALYADPECGDVSCECRHCGQSITVHAADLEEALARLGEWDATHECEAA